MDIKTTPDKISGFEEALEAGLLPSIPNTPPKIVTLNSTKILILCIIAFFGSGFAAIQISNMSFSPTWVDVAIFSIPLMCGLATLYLPNKARNKEYTAGYTYVDDAVMTYGIKLSKLFEVQNHAGPSGYNWNFRGLWKLNNNGSVNRPPVPGVLPIGYYPSPTRPGKFEYWTGAEWTGKTGKFLSADEIPQGGKLIP